MHILLAGAAGAVGGTLIPTLREHGHTVAGTTRSEARFDALRALGAEPVLMDGLDADSVRAAVAATEPDAILHEMTALTDIDFRHFDRGFAVTNRLRTEGTEHLLAAAAEHGVTRVIAQSYAGWPYARTGGPVKTESDAFDPDPPSNARESLAAIRRLEELVTDAHGVILRYGGLYGPGTGLAADGDQLRDVRKRKFPIVGDGGGIWSFAHIEDVATATVAALERATPGEIYNVCDDEPAAVREWLPVLASTIGAPPPRHVPVWLGRLLAGPQLVSMMTEVRGASNAKAKAELGWTPEWPTWREGFAALTRRRERAAS
jgi:2-alkyl-3-oxoalkanoate reductase